MLARRLWHLAAGYLVREKDEEGRAERVGDYLDVFVALRQQYWTGLTN